MPDYAAQVGLTYVHPTRITAKVAQTLVGPRVGAHYYSNRGNPVSPKLPTYSTTDASIGWKSPTGHLEVSLQLLNIFDKDYDMVLGVPGPGRTFYASMKARF